MRPLNQCSATFSRDKYHRRVFLWRPGTWDPNVISLGDFYSCGFALMEIISLEEESQIAGVSVVCDSVDFGFKQLKNTSVGDLKFLSMFAQVFYGPCYENRLIKKIPTKPHNLSVSFRFPFSEV